MKSDLIDWIFSFFHLFLLIGLFIYAFVSLFMGNTIRFGIIIVCLTVYYFLVLHKNVVKEVKRTKKKGGAGKVKE